MTVLTINGTEHKKCLFGFWISNSYVSWEADNGWLAHRVAGWEICILGACDWADQPAGSS